VLVSTAAPCSGGDKYPFDLLDNQRQLPNASQVKAAQINIHKVRGSVGGIFLLHLSATQASLWRRDQVCTGSTFQTNERKVPQESLGKVPHLMNEHVDLSDFRCRQVHVEFWW